MVPVTRTEMAHEPFAEWSALAAVGALDGAERGAFRRPSGGGVRDLRGRTSVSSPRWRRLCRGPCPTCRCAPEVRERLMARVGQAASAPTLGAAAARRRRPPSAVGPGWRWAGGLVAAGLATALVWGLHDARQALELERARVARLEQELGRSAPSRRSWRAPTPTSRAPRPGAAARAEGWIVWSPSRREGFMVVHHLPILPAGQQYRFWVVGSGWLPAGRFEVDAIGHAALIVRAPREHPERFVITVEPAASEAGPSGGSVMEGAVQLRPAEWRRRGPLPIGAVFPVSIACSDPPCVRLRAENRHEHRAAAWAGTSAMPRSARISRWTRSRRSRIVPQLVARSRPTSTRTSGAGLRPRLHPRLLRASRRRPGAGASPLRRAGGPRSAADRPAGAADAARRARHARMAARRGGRGDRRGDRSGGAPVALAAAAGRGREPGGDGPGRAGGAGPSGSLGAASRGDDLDSAGHAPDSGRDDATSGLAEPGGRSCRRGDAGPSRARPLDSCGRDDVGARHADGGSPAEETLPPGSVREWRSVKTLPAHHRQRGRDPARAGRPPAARARGRARSSTRCSRSERGREVPLGPRRAVERRAREDARRVRGGLRPHLPGSGARAGDRGGSRSAAPPGRSRSRHRRGLRRAGAGAVPARAPHRRRCAPDAGGAPARGDRRSRRAARARRAARGRAGRRA